MLKRLLLPALLLSAGILTAQDLLQFTRSCSYKGQETAGAYYTFNPSNEAERIVQEICNAVSLQKNFTVRAAEVANAVATSAGNQRMILYNTLFLEQFKTGAGTRWAAYSVLAHEIGHHLNGHDFNEQDPARRKQMELEADFFSGGALRLLGATLDEAKAGIETFAAEAGSATHPKGPARREAIASGWKAKDELLENLGVPRPPATTAPDSDGDGVPDATDRCPTDFGTSAAGGCPDADADGTTDADDRCPYLSGPARWQGCPDSDGDGLPDHQDKCPNQRGTATLEGCPPADTDADGVPDQSDKCPRQAGLPRFQGCPDTDDDGVPDNADKCPSVKGLPSLDGCPEMKLAPSVLEEYRYTDPLVGVMVKVSGGKFKMGCTAEQQNCAGDEYPVHDVTLSDYYIGEKEITQAQWRAVMGSDPTELYNKGCDQCPVEGISWDDVQEFLIKLNARSQRIYRLPTEAEWEYAARGGQQTKNYQYAGDNDIDKVAWYYSNFTTETNLGAQKTPPPVGTKAANELGLYDMTGNVWEWCSDWYGSDYYKSNQVSNPVGPLSGSYRVLRGGSWSLNPHSCRVALRYSNVSGYRGGDVGFRLAFVP